MRSLGSSVIGFLVCTAAVCVTSSAVSAGLNLTSEASGVRTIYWLGTKHEGFPLTSDDAGRFIYGTCRATDDGGCAPPLEVSNDSTCSRNPVAIETTPTKIARARGWALVSRYDDGSLDLNAGRTTVTIFARSERLARSAIEGLQPRSGDLSTAEFPAPKFPPAVLRELKRVVVAHGRLGSVDAVSRRTGLSKDDVRSRLLIARLLPPGTLLRVKRPSQSWRIVQRNRQVALVADELGTRQAARQFRLTVNEVRRAARRVRGLTGRC